MNIEINCLTKQYGSNIVLDIPSLTLHDGEVVGLVGNNGAGKTTLMRLMLDLIEATSGQVLADSKNVAEHPFWKDVTGSFIDATFLIDFYTPEEFFGFVAEAYSIDKEELEQRLLRFEHFMNGEVMGTGKLIHDFSNGIRQKIGIIAAMLIHPALLILDEPINYLDPSSQLEVARLIRQMNWEFGTTVLVSSHNLTSINDICDRILLLEKGRVIKDTPHEPGTHDETLEQYFLNAVQ